MSRQLTDLSTDDLLGLVATSDDETTFAQAVGELVLRYKNLVYWQAHKICRDDPSLVEDVFQDTFLRLFTWLKNRKGQPSLISFPGLLRVFAKRAAIDLVRKNARTVTSSQLPELESDEDIESAFYARSLLESLEGLQKEVVRLSFFEQLSAKEIANELSLTPGHVRVLRFRALEKIRARQALDELANLADPV